MVKYDIIIIGAGPNGLTAGAYLAKQGLKVLILERKLEAGGGLATEEVTLPGFLHNTHSIYHMMVDYAPAYKDLALDNSHYKVRYVYPSLQFALPLRDGRAVCLYTDVEQTCKSLAQFSKHDADSYRDMHRRFKEYMEAFLAPATYVPPISALEQAAKLDDSELGREITAYSEKSPKQIVDELFEDEHVRTLMLYTACHWGLEYDIEGVGYLAVLYLNRATNYRLCVGGSHMLSQGLNKVLIENGGMVWGSQRIKRILVEGGVARGVELEDGRMVEAGKAIISTIDPHQTFLKLVGEDKLENDFVDRLNDWKWESWSLFETHLALEAAPQFTHPETAGAFVHVMGYETTQDLINHWDAIKRGELIAGAGFNACFPSIHDPSQAPPGKYTALISQMAPYNLKEGTQKWYGLKFKEEQAERCLDVMQRYIPNVRDALLWKSMTTPLDIQNKFLDMVQGSIKQGAYHPFQMGYLRPNEQCSQNRTPIKNLYLGGASCHPGGLVLLGPGYVAAGSVVEDLGQERWWKEPETVTVARQAGLL